MRVLVLNKPELKEVGKVLGFNLEFLAGDESGNKAVITIRVDKSDTDYVVEFEQGKEVVLIGGKMIEVEGI